MNIVVIHNPKSGKADSLERIRRSFANANVTPEFMPITHRRVRAAIRTMAKRRAPVVVAAGGDGTVSAVAAYVQDTGCALGIIPAGTLNHFAKDIGLPIGIDEAVRTILTGSTKRVDIGRVNHRLFVNNSSIGIYPQSLRTRQKYDGTLGKWPAAVYGVMRVLLRPRRYRVHMTIDGKTITRRTPFVLIGNNVYTHTQPQFLDRPRIDKGVLSIYVVKVTGPLSVMRLFVRALFAREPHRDDFEMYTAARCTISSRHASMHVARDGEVTSMSTPLAYVSVPGALRVITPAAPVRDKD